MLTLRHKTALGERIKMSVNIEIKMSGQFPEGSHNREIAEKIAKAVRDIIEQDENITSKSIYATEYLREVQQRAFPDGREYQAWGKAHDIGMIIYFHTD